jgi:hypothetical protein
MGRQTSTLGAQAKKFSATSLQCKIMPFSESVNAASPFVFVAFKLSR